MSAALGVTRTSWFDLRLPPDAVHFGVPSLTATVVVAFAEPTDTGWFDEGAHRGYRVLVAGLHARPSLVRTHGRQLGLQLALTPAGARRLLGRPIGELANRIVELDDLEAAQLAPLVAGVRAADPVGRPDVLRRGLRELAGCVGDEAAARAVEHAPRPEVAEAWRLVVAGGGRLPVDEVARRVGWSRRTLAARFADEYGLGPKQVARVARFVRARRLAEAGVRLADVAARTGYSDQSHLTREWADIAGRPPTRAIGDDFPNLQDADVAAAAR